MVERLEGNMEQWSGGDSIKITGGKRTGARQGDNSFPRRQKIEARQLIIRRNYVDEVISREGAGATEPDQVHLDQTGLGRQGQTVGAGISEMEGIASSRGMPRKGGTGLFEVLGAKVAEALLRERESPHCSVRAAS